jgi:hypothetical protein
LYSSTSLKKNTKVLEAIVANLYKLALEKAIQFDLAKTELIYFTSGKKANKISLKLPNSKLVQPSKLVKWLGVYFD